MYPIAYSITCTIAGEAIVHVLAYVLPLLSCTTPFAFFSIQTPEATTIS